MTWRPLVLGSALLLGVAAVPGSAEPTPPKVKREPPRTIEELGRILDALPGRLQALYDTASQDPRWPDIHRYMKQTEADFKDSKRIKAEKIVGYMLADEADFRFR